MPELGSVLASFMVGHMRVPLLLVKANKVGPICHDAEVGVSFDKFHGWSHSCSFAFGEGKQGGPDLP
jgi:hypothetical protein